MRIHRWFLIAALLCATQARLAQAVDVNDVAEGYVKLVLEVGLYDEDYVDAYWGPAAWRPDDEPDETFPAQRLRDKADTLSKQLHSIDRAAFADIEQSRYDFLDKQLRSVRGKIDLLAGVKMSFDEESRILYDAVAPAWDEAHYQGILDELDRFLPGDGPLYWQFNSYRIKSTVPRAQVTKALSAAIAACRDQTVEHLPLPDDEGYEMEFAFGKPWGAALTYQGNGTSLVEVNRSAPFVVADIGRTARHEMYPGHHTHLTLLDRQLFQGRGWVEFSVLPLHSPLALVAEGIAEYGSYDLFPAEQRLAFERAELLPMTSLDPNQAQTCDTIMRLKSELDGALVEGARRYLDGTIDDGQMREWLRRYYLAGPGSETAVIQFIEQHRSYIINYTVGRRLVRAYINRHGGAESQNRRWELLQTLLTTPQTPSALAAERQINMEGGEVLGNRGRGRPVKPRRLGAKHGTRRSGGN